MLGSEYQKCAMRTNDKKSSERLSKFINDNPQFDVGGLLNGIMGLTGESGEFADLFKKAIFHEKGLDIAHARKELGDVIWYIAMICESANWNLDEIMQENKEKLEARYPEGFDTVLANNRKAGDI